MAFDSTSRTALQRLVSDVRALLDDEFSAQLASVYGIQENGEMTSLESLSHLSDEDFVVAAVLRKRITHLCGTSKGQIGQAVGRVIREQAFTVLNRFAALRMAEQRGLVRECVAKGYESDGFKLYLTTSGSAMGERYERYRSYLLALFDEIAVDLGVLFDRYSPEGMLFPRQQALEDLLQIVNRDECSELWTEDETIGWVYQYFNSKQERETMRKAGAPRNSRELAVRNQFFTPRYVVAFLVDNTLGRLWSQMTKGKTSLMERCEYLVHEKPGEERAAPLKDPRGIHLLDPACGSMHFGLYAFELLQIIYEEAWDNFPELLADLRSVYESKESFLLQVPGLILRHNLHGIDIDRRAVQIAALSLWLRAQRSYENLGIKAADRPPIAHVQLACAEPMPIERTYLEELAFAQRPSFLADVVRDTWEEMKLAGEVGSLLKVEETLDRSLGRVRKALEKFHHEIKEEKGLFLFEEQQQKELQLLLGFDAEHIDTSTEWGRIEQGMVAALRALVERASGTNRYERGLFAHDAVMGLSFIDILRKRYDVVLMNPPFGDPSVKAKQYIVDHYPRTKNDLYAAFVERFLHRLDPAGYLGAITSRTGFFLSSFTKWREEVLLTEAEPIVFADLGFGVLEAMVETAAYVLAPSKLT